MCCSVCSSNEAERVLRSVCVVCVVVCVALCVAVCVAVCGPQMRLSKYLNLLQTS